jgi:hypothetical protein
MKTVDTLVDDIYELVSGGIAPATSNNKVDVSYSKWFSQEERKREDKVLYFSEVGDPCPRRLWYKYNMPSVGDKPDGRSLLKFFYGDILEELVLNVAEDAGHSVAKKQERVVYEIGDGWIVRGRIDAVIDGVTVDVKSVTKYSEEKFKNNLVDDPFGYYQQLNGYATALGTNDAGFLTIQKELGHVNYYPIEVNKSLFKLQTEHAVETVSLPSPDVIKRLDAVPASKTSKNKKLCTSCSYCNFKKECWPEMRTFLYASGPEFLVDVVDVPRVMEITNESN